MTTYKTPGVFVREIPYTIRSIERTDTTTAVFVGMTSTGPLSKAVRITSFAEFSRHFGNPVGSEDVMALSVQAYFNNGGKAAYICRLDGRPSVGDYDDCFNHVLNNHDDISVVVLPDEQWADDGTGNPALKAGLAHCEKMGDRMLIIDLPENLRLKDPQIIRRLQLPTSRNAVVYYPWVRVANPFYDRSRRQPRTLRIPPSAFAAGIWARTDINRGVWKAPAGPEARLSGCIGLQFAVTKADQDLLNPLGVNCLRTLAGIGTVLWGVRTLAAASDPEFKYLSVRRTAIMIKESLRRGTRWVVFEPNAEPLWAQVRQTVGNFLFGLFRDGALQGTKPEDAYFLRCGLGETMTQDDILNGVVRVTVGFAPLKPAEFIIIQFQHKLAES